MVGWLVGWFVYILNILAVRRETENYTAGSGTHSWDMQLGHAWGHTVEHAFGTRSWDIQLGHAV